MNTDGYRLSVGLLAGNTLNVDDIFKTVDRCDFAFAAFIRPTSD